MSRCHLTLGPTGGLTVTFPAAREYALEKCLFEISRTTDMTTPFDRATHTLDAIAAGISGHRAVAVLGECEDTDLPTDMYFRGAWEWSD